MAGAALLSKPALVVRILEAVVNAIEVPVTLKIRTGIDPAHRNAVEIAHIAADAGIRALTVHAIKREVSIPVIANGNIDSPHKEPSGSWQRPAQMPL